MKRRAIIPGDEADEHRRRELARLLAEAYLRHLRARSAKQREQAQLRASISSQLSGYRVPPE